MADDANYRDLMAHLEAVFARGDGEAQFAAPIDAPSRMMAGAGTKMGFTSGSLGMQGDRGSVTANVSGDEVGTPAGYSIGVNAGPVGYQQSRPMQRGAPAQHSFSLNLDPEEVGARLKAILNQSPGGRRSYGVGTGGEGWGAQAVYDPHRKALQISGGLERRFAHGGSVPGYAEGGLMERLRNLLKGDDYQSTGQKTVNDGQVNWGDSDSAADFFRADKARMALDKARSSVANIERASAAPLPPRRPMPEAAPAPDRGDFSRTIPGAKPTPYGALNRIAQQPEKPMPYSRWPIASDRYRDVNDWTPAEVLGLMRAKRSMGETVTGYAQGGSVPGYLGGGPYEEAAPVALPEAPADDTVQLGEARPLTIRRGPLPVSIAPRPETGEDYEASVERQALNRMAKRQAAIEAEAARPREILEDVGRKFNEYTMPRYEDYAHFMDQMTKASTDLTRSGKEDMLSGYEFLGAGKSALGTVLPVIAPFGAAIEAGLLNPAGRTFGPAARHAVDVLSNLTPGGGTVATGTKILAGVPVVGKVAKEAGPLTRLAEKSAVADSAALAKEAPKIEEARAITGEFELPRSADDIGAAAKEQQPITGGNEDLQFTNLERNAPKKVKKATLTPDEEASIQSMAESNGVDADKAKTAFLAKKQAYPESAGWEPFEISGFERGSDKKVVFDDDGLPVLKLKQEAYEFHGPEGNRPTEATNWSPAHVDDMANKLVKEVKAVADRDAKGDPAAKVIMSARGWYRTMRDRLRQEYGGFADTMADVLGTTSAQTGVRQNWDNTIEVLSQFSRGAYDRTLTKLDDFLKAGGEMGSAGTRNGSGYINRHLDEVKSRMPAALEKAKEEGITDAKKLEKRAKDIAFQETQQGDFPLITKADGKTLFNANSPPTMLALLDKFRERKAGDAPKTPNFTGNLIGYSDKATIDVWAARLLRRLSGRKRLAPDAEQGVGGTVLEGPLPSGVQVGGEFGFGQEVFKKAAAKLKKDPRFQGLGDDDLQAIAWFLEKERWGKNGWTTKAGEGGSLELEANFAGANDREALKEARRLAETDPTFGARIKLKEELASKKTIKARQKANDILEQDGWALNLTHSKLRDTLAERDGIDRVTASEQAKALVNRLKAAEKIEKGFAAKEERLKTLEQRSKEIPAAAREELNNAQAIARRFTGGLSPHREVSPATSEMFREGTGVIENVLREDPSVIMSKATTSRGRYIDPQGNIWDEPSYDLEFVTRQKFDPQPVFSDMVAQAKKRDQESVFLSEAVPAGTVEGANPGIEVYFSKKVDDATAEKLTQIINGLDVDAGFTFVTDYKAKNRAAAGENVGEYVGIRVQYVPEFGGGVEGLSNAQDKMLSAINQITSFDGVSSARYVEYDTQVLFRDQYDGYLAGNLPEGRKAQWTGQRSGQGNPTADRLAGPEQRAVGGSVLRGELPAKPEGYAQGGSVRGYATGGPADDQIEALYNKYTGRSADPEGRAYWQSQLAGMSPEEQDAAFLKGANAAYAANAAAPGPVSDAQIKNLYQQYAGREADQGGLEYWKQKAAAPGATYADLSNQFRQDVASAGSQDQVQTVKAPPWLEKFDYENFSTPLDAGLDYLKRTLGDKAAAALYGNFNTESYANPQQLQTAGGPNGRPLFDRLTNMPLGMGLAQWDPERQNKLYQFADKYGVDPNSTEGQLRFVVNNFATNPKLARWLERIQNPNTNLSDATQIVQNKYEVPRDKKITLAARRADADMLLRYMNKGTLTPAEQTKIAGIQGKMQDPLFASKMAAKQDLIAKNAAAEKAKLAGTADILPDTGFNPVVDTSVNDRIMQDANDRQQQLIQNSLNYNGTDPNSLFNSYMTLPSTSFSSGGVPGGMGGVDSFTGLSYMPLSELLGQSGQSGQSEFSPYSPYAEGGSVGYAEGGSFQPMFEGDSEMLQMRAKQLAKQAYSDPRSLSSEDMKEWNLLAGRYNLPFSAQNPMSYEDEMEQRNNALERNLSAKERRRTYAQGGAVDAYDPAEIDAIAAQIRGAA